MEYVKVIINGKECLAEKGEFLLDIAERNGIVIPHLCRHESLRGLASCRLCIAEVTENGRKKIVTSCIFPVLRDIEAETDTRELRDIRKTLVTLLMAEVPDNERISLLAEEYGAGDSPRFSADQGNECMMCGLCVKACEELGCNAIATVNRGTAKKVSTPYEEPSAVCIGCGACAYVCPTGCIKMQEGYGVRKIWGKEFELIRCDVCGRQFMAKEQYEYLSKKCDSVEAPVCESCKQAGVARKLMDVCEL
ncbi:MAG TPA: 2Fe-2S iron-sulfur cluster-binding protein [Anaerovoracaceae bacterium]|nr:2Fe-2S iron-sulfur cluster-binding protein [Anaerovoracaceae bacterium]